MSKHLTWKSISDRNLNTHKKYIDHSNFVFVKNQFKTVQELSGFFFFFSTEKNEFFNFENILKLGAAFKLKAINRRHTYTNSRVYTSNGLINLTIKFFTRFFVSSCFYVFVVLSFHNCIRPDGNSSHWFRKICFYFINLLFECSFGCICIFMPIENRDREIKDSNYLNQLLNDFYRKKIDCCFKCAFRCKKKEFTQN